MTDEIIAQRKLVEEYMNGRYCIAAWKPKGSLLILADLPSHEPLFDLLFDNGFEVKNIALGDWQYYCDAKVPNIECWIVDDERLFNDLEIRINNWTHERVDS